MRYEAVLLPEFYQRRFDVPGLMKGCVAGLEASGHKAWIVEPAPTYDADRIMVWGVGHPVSASHLDEAIKRGIPCISWDLGYWDRGNYFRVSINGMHPDRIVMSRERSGSRWEGARLPLKDTWDPNSPIILCGMGWKSARMYGERFGAWEERKAQEISRAFPDRKVLFRAKPANKGCRKIEGLEPSTGSIEDALKGASLVVCRHSNVAIDAIISGVPSVCEGGAARAVFPSGLEAEHRPLPDETRRRFLANLAWFQWTKAEMKLPSTWAVIEEMIADAN